MSAFIVSKRHVDALVEAGLRPEYAGARFSWYHDAERHELTLSNADEVGAMLWAENVRSVEHRYEHVVEAGESLPGTYQLETIAPGIEPIEVPEWVGEYRYDMRTRQLDPVAVLKLVQCFDYQSCEHDDWRESSAFAYCQTLKDKLIGMLPGYDAAKWGI